jgi:hypothetical protein
MNDDAFEKKLESLAGALPRLDPTPQWKADILARARREAGASIATPRRVLPPRWLMTVWCTAWAVIAMLHISTPAGTSIQESAAPLAGTKRGSDTRSDTPSADSSSLTLLAFHRELSTTSSSTTTRFDIP